MSFVEREKGVLRGIKSPPPGFTYIQSNVSREVLKGRLLHQAKIQQVPYSSFTLHGVVENHVLGLQLLLML